jgi:hypothetical protein
MMLVLAFLFPTLAHAQVNCDVAATPAHPAELSCGADRVSSFVAKTQKVSGFTLLVSDPSRGLEQKVEIHKVNLTLAKLSVKNLASLPAVKSELAKIKKDWKDATPKLEILSYEFDGKTAFFAGNDLKAAIPVAKLMRAQPRNVASETQPHSGGIRKTDK